MLWCFGVEAAATGLVTATFLQALDSTELPVGGIHELPSMEAAAHVMMCRGPLGTDAVSYTSAMPTDSRFPQPLPFSSAPLSSASSASSFSSSSPLLRCLPSASLANSYISAESILGNYLMI